MSVQRVLRKATVLVLLGGLSFSAFASNSYDLSISRGNNYIANQLDDGVGNLLNNALTNGVASGSTFSEWNPATGSLTLASEFNGTSWSINYSLSPNGTGGILNSSSASTVIISGSLPYVASVSPLTFDYVPPVRSPGFYLLADGPPVAGATFQDIIGRDPANGEFVETLNAAAQTPLVDTFSGGAWNNGSPSLAVGQAAFFSLNMPVPEPATFALAGLGTLLAVSVRRLGQRRN